MRSENFAGFDLAETKTDPIRAWGPWASPPAPSHVGVRSAPSANYMRPDRSGPDEAVRPTVNLERQGGAVRARRLESCMRREGVQAFRRQLCCCVRRCVFRVVRVLGFGCCGRTGAGRGAFILVSFVGRGLCTAAVVCSHPPTRHLRSSVVRSLSRLSLSLFALFLLRSAHTAARVTLLPIPSFAQCRLRNSSSAVLLRPGQSQRSSASIQNWLSATAASRHPRPTSRPQAAQRQ